MKTLITIKQEPIDHPEGFFAERLAGHCQAEALATIRAKIQRRASKSCLSDEVVHCLMLLAVCRGAKRDNDLSKEQVEGYRREMKLLQPVYDYYKTRYADTDSAWLSLACIPPDPDTRRLAAVFIGERYGHLLRAFEERGIFKTHQARHEILHSLKSRFILAIGQRRAASGRATSVYPANCVHFAMSDALQVADVKDAAEREAIIAFVLQEIVCETTEKTIHDDIAEVQRLISKSPRR
ncbi:MAG: hypothetical protein NTW86_15275 [Candidatus Sumerlaeota bacterium]|nr:hypothetical protein [Candidatus Sumerlaeota bacterium]